MKATRSLISREFFWEATLLAGGVAIIGLTLNIYPSFDPSRSLAPRPHFSPGEADRQIESAASYIQSHPEDINSHIALAMAYYQKGPDKYVEAMNALDKARALGATSDHLFYYAGVMYEALGLPEYAINEYTKYLRHHPNDYETMIRLANTQFRQKRFDEAHALYKKALKEYPKDPTAWFNYALVNKEKGNYPQALNCLEQVVRLAKRLPPGGLYQKGEIYRLQGDDTKALELYQQELAAQPEDIPALEATEKIVRAKGDIKESRLLRKRISELKKRPAAAASAPAAS